MNQINAIIKETIERVPLPLLLLEDIARNLVPIRGPSPEPYCASTVAFRLQNCDKFQSFISWTSQVMRVVKNPPANARNTRHRFDPWVGNIPWRRKWLPTPVFLTGEFHGQRSLAGYSPWGHKELDATNAFTFFFYKLPALKQLVQTKTIIYVQ